MLTPQFLLPLADEIFIDNFAGGGGASTGIERAIGRPVDVAINHDPEAVAMHAANHPQTLHLCESVWDVDPRTIYPGRPIGGAWFSPDCKHFSKAKGGKPVEKKIRGLAWVAVRWCAVRRPRIVWLENVEEFVTWGPLTEDGRPCPRNKGREFRAFVNALQRLGYAVEWRELRACDYGTPTSRKRLFLIARCDGQPIVWPEPTHGPGRPKPWRTAVECIDWSLPCPSIFERERPLAEATLRRVAEGVRRFVVEAAEPYIVRIGHTGHGDAGKVRRVGEPLSTITSKAEHLLVAPFVAPLRGTSQAHKSAHSAASPLSTISAGGQHHALVAAFLAKHYTGVIGQDLRKPIGTVTATDHHSLVQAFLIKFYGSGGQWSGLNEPMHTLPARDRMGLVTVAGEQYRIADIGLRMLQPHELAKAQGFGPNYILDAPIHGRRLPKHAQVRMIGNSVCPDLAAALVRANYSEHQALAKAA
ncbi:DNA cytosine methyltransferase [Flavobacterium sp.]|jgi:DNA (cytosine-5)-methyltransferase 1|uniref:DNA cytosine methyltransferase n=1 Tax=Flavobacterium sp. TaxID=239 RepID=UPI0037BEB6A0